MMTRDTNGEGARRLHFLAHKVTMRLVLVVRQLQLHELHVAHVLGVEFIAGRPD
jgi:hypothetical protein